jgi:osmotically-inducible protein OsmY
MYRIILASSLALAMAGCNSLIASATGPDPIGSSSGTRTLSQRIEDGSIERTAGVNMHKANANFRQANVNILSFYGSVLLAGQVPSEELKAEAERVVRRIAEVKQVHNELTVGPSSYYQERSSDGVISMRIRSAFTFEKGFPASRTKILTVAGTVYLMGKLTSDESEQAINLIKQVAGVKKIIKLVDLLPSPESAPTPVNAPAPSQS